MRRIQAPGIEINEIDKSAYNDQFDESLVDTTSLICGFASKGHDYEAQYVNSMVKFADIYGTPTNEAERYFYYGAKEVLDNRGQLICVKLPYDNNSLDKLAYTTYEIDNIEIPLSSTFTIVSKNLPLINHPVENQIVDGNSFFDVLNMTLMNKDGFNDIDNSYRNIQTTYVKDLIDYAFNASNIPAYIWNTYSKYFKSSMIGMWNFKKLFSYTLSAQSFVENVILDISSANDVLPEDYDYRETFDVDSWQDYQDLSIILQQAYQTYSGINTEYDNLFYRIAKDFICTKQLSEIKLYYYNLSSTVTPILDSIKDSFTVDAIQDGELHESTQHRWKLYFSNLSNFVDNVEHPENDLFLNNYSDLGNIDSAITSMVCIKSLDSVERSQTGEIIRANTGLMPLDEFDNLKTTKIKVRPNTFKIVEIARTNYQMNNDNVLECIGILPVVTTAVNALHYQYLIKNSVSTKTFNSFSKVQCVFTQMPNAEETYQDLSKDEYYDYFNNEYLFESMISCDVEKQSYADVAVSNFPTLSYTASKHIDKNYLKQIGIVVFKMQKNTSMNKIQLVPVESFVGSLDYYGKDLNNGASNFIDNLVNNNSKYINVFSNIDCKEGTAYDHASILNISNQTATSLGFYSADRVKTISLKNSIKGPLLRIFDNLKNIDAVNIDLVVDSGVSTIAQFISLMSIQGEFASNERREYFDINAKRYVDFSILNKFAVKEWKTVIDMYDNFCKNVRKDCMFIADALRSTCVVANQPNLRSTTTSTSFKKEIVDKLDYQINVNTSYGAGYCNWFYAYDQFSKTYYWCPPSIKAAGKYIYTDIYYNYWDAPAGLNRGVVDNVYGIAFNPTNDEAGMLYNRSWNYAVQYPLYGYVIEGQHTFQINKTAFDRVNVRRLFLKMEKLVYRIAKRFCYEGNTPYMRQRFVDAIRPIFEEAVQGSGISEYVIICDERNNKTINIENHELHCTIAVRPIKTIEFIVMNFIAMPQSGSFSEETILSMTPYYE